MRNSGKLLCSLFAVFLAVIFTSSGIDGKGKMTGYQIMKKQKDTHKAKTEYEEQEMILIDKKGNKTKREVKSWAKEVGKDIHKGMLVFLSPSDIKGTTLLTWQNKARDDDQWLYEPARPGKMQRVSSGSKHNYFMGTDYTYEDLQTEELEDFNYTLLKDVTLDDQACYVIEARPKTATKKKEAGYAKRKLWINKEHLYTIKVEFYDKNTKKLIKTQFGRKFEKVTGKKWRPMENVIVNHKLNHKTFVNIEKRVLDKSMDDSMFTDRYILKGSHM